MRIMYSWQATPMRVENMPGGTAKLVLYTQRDGSLEWEYDRNTGCVSWIGSYNSARNLEWEEQRKVELRDGNAILTSRIRHDYIPQVGMVMETLDWQTGPGSVQRVEVLPE